MGPNPSYAAGAIRVCLRRRFGYKDAAGESFRKEVEMDVPMLDLRAQYATIREEVLQAMGEVLEGQLVCNGPAVREFETDLAAYCGTAAALGVSSGTDALLVSLMTLGIGPGDQVITTPFTFFASAGTICRVGAQPVFVDIEPDTFNIDPAKIKQAITDNTKAIIPVHLYGQMVEMDAVMAIAAKHDLRVIEDAAQAIGSAYRGKPAGTIGTVGCLSFYPTKNLGAMGDAGAVITQDAALDERLRTGIDHGQSPKYHHRWIGGNFRMDSIQAAALSVKLRRLDQWTDRRRAIAARYDEALAGVEGVTTPPVREHCRHNYYLYVIRARRRDELQAFLSERGVAATIHYPRCLHQQECFAYLGHSEGDFPVAEQAAAEVLALPMYPELTGEQIEYVAEKVREFCA